MAPYDSLRPPGALALHQAMFHWLPAEVSAKVKAAQDDLRDNARRVYRIDEQGRRVFEIDAHSDFNRLLLLRMREAQDAAAAWFLAMLRAGRLAAWGRIGSPLAPMRPIPADAWATLAIRHVAEGRASGGGIEVFALHVAPPPPAAPCPAAPAAVPDHPPTAPAAAAPLEPEAAHPAPKRRSGGRPPRDDWPAFDKETSRRLALDGGNLTLRGLRAHMKDWAARHMDPVPDDRTIERRLDERVPLDVLAPD